MKRLTQRQKTRRVTQRFWRLGVNCNQRDKTMSMTELWVVLGGLVLGYMLVSSLVGSRAKPTDPPGAPGNSVAPELNIGSEALHWT